MVRLGSALKDGSGSAACPAAARARKAHVGNMHRVIIKSCEGSPMELGHHRSEDSPNGFRDEGPRAESIRTICILIGQLHAPRPLVGTPARPAAIHFRLARVARSSEGRHQHVRRRGTEGKRRIVSDGQAHERLQVDITPVHHRIRMKSKAMAYSSARDRRRSCFHIPCPPKRSRESDCCCRPSLDPGPARAARLSTAGWPTYRGRAPWTKASAGAPVFFAMRAPCASD